MPKHVVRTVTESYAVEGNKLSGAIRNEGRRHLSVIVGMRKRKLSQLKRESYEQKLIIYTYPQYWSVGEVAAMSRRAFYRDILLLRCAVNTTQHTPRNFTNTGRELRFSTVVNQEKAEALS